MQSPSQWPFFAMAAKGTEGVLRDELRELGLRPVKATRGGVHFGGELSAAMRVCFESRIAQRVLWQRATFVADSEEALYTAVRELDTSDVLDPKRTLSVSASVKHGELRHTGFVAQKTKDALVDAQRQRWGVRSSVDRVDADVRFFMHIQRDQATLYVDLSGEPLHRRGYRNEAGDAPLKETLAAAILRLCQWDRQAPLVDPMCGSGTIALEAMLWARQVAPGLLGRRYGFMRWASFDGAANEALRQIRERCRDEVRPASQAPTIMALDRDPRAVAIAQRLAKRANLHILVQQLDVRDFMGTDPAGWVVTNPPYGVRLERGQRFEREVAQAFRDLRRHRVSAICHDPGLMQAMGRPEREHALWNGDLECRLYSWAP